MSAPIRRVLIPAAIVGAFVVGLARWVERPADLAVVVSASHQVPSPPSVSLCSALSSKADAPVGSDVRTIEAELYLAIVRLRTGSSLPNALLVEAASIPFIPMRILGDPSATEQLPVELRVAARDGNADCFLQTADRFPPGTRLVPYADIRQGARGRADWPSVAARFDGAHMWFAFSRALITTDRRDAVVFYERPCYARCGEAEWVWFHREGASEGWQVMKQVWRWIS